MLFRIIFLPLLLALLLLSTPAFSGDWYIYEHDMTTEYLNFFGTEGYFVVGDNGVVLRCDYWTSKSSPFNETFEWEDVSAPTSEDLFGVCLGADTHVVGTSGIILYSEFLGWDWTFIDSPTTKDLYSITLPGYFSGFIVGAEGTILYGGGEPPVWELYEPSPTDQDLYSVCGNRPYPNSTWAVGAGGTILDYEDGVWSLYPDSPTANDLYGVYTSGYSLAWTCGAGGTIIHWDGVSWSLQDTPTNEDLYSIWYGENLYCVGANGTILHTYDYGSNWYIDDCPVSVNLHGVAGYIPEWAVGDGGTILSNEWIGSNIQPISVGKVKALFAPSVEAAGAKDDVK